jgi:hypothetical protein
MQILRFGQPPHGIESGAMACQPWSLDWDVLSAYASAGHVGKADARRTTPADSLRMESRAEQWLASRSLSLGCFVRLRVRWRRRQSRREANDSGGQPPHGIESGAMACQP